jgi:hypothetical protein
MTKVPPPRGKGEPPLPTHTIGNLDKPESEDLVPLNFKVPPAFKREFRMFAAAHDKYLVEVLYSAFNSLKNETQN